MRVLCYLMCLVFAAPFAALALTAILSPDIAQWALHAVELKSILYSILSGLLAALGTAVLGTALAYQVCFYRFPLQTLVEKLLVLPLLFPTFALGAVYKELFAASGLLVEKAGMPSALSIDFQSLSGFTFVMALGLFPYVYLLSRIMLDAYGKSFFDLGHSLGLSTTRSFRKILFPFALPAVLLGASLVFVETSGEWATASLLSAHTSALSIHELWFARNEPHLASQLAFLFVVIALAALVPLRRLAEAGHSQYLPVIPAGGRAESREGETARFRWLRTMLCALPGLLGFLVPAATIGYYFVRTIGAIDLSSLIASCINTLSLLAAVLGISVAFALVLGAAYRASSGAPTGRIVRWLTASYSIPGTVLAVGVLLVIGYTPLADLRLSDRFSFFILALSLSIRFACCLLVPLFIGLSFSYREVADTGAALGLGNTRAFFRLHLPHVKRFAWLGVLLLLLQTLKETGICVALSPFAFQTLVLKAYGYVNINLLPESAAWILVTAALGAYPLLTIEGMLSRRHAAWS